MSGQRKIDEREQAIYGDIPAGEAKVSQEYLDATLPKHLKDHLAKRAKGKDKDKAHEKSGAD